MTDKMNGNFVRYIQPVVSGLILVTLIGGYNEIINLKVEVARLQTKIEHGMGDRFTGKEGAELARRILLLENIAIKHENRIDSLESRTEGM